MRDTVVRGGGQACRLLLLPGSPDPASSPERCTLRGGGATWATVRETVSDGLSVSRQDGREGRPVVGPAPPSFQFTLGGRTPPPRRSDARCVEAALPWRPCCHFMVSACVLLVEQRCGARAATRSGHQTWGRFFPEELNVHICINVARYFSMAESE